MTTAHPTSRRPRRPGLALALLLLTVAPRALSAQGWIEPLPGRDIPLGTGSIEKTRSRVRVTVAGRVAQVVVTEWFRNEGRRVAEGDYLYPLPGEAAFAGFSLWQGGDELRGELIDRERARRIYEDIVRRHADPALIELAGYGLLRARVFPLQPDEERRVEIRYTQVLERTGDALRFRYAGSIRRGEIAPPRPAARDGGDRGGRRDAEEGAARTDFQMVVEDGDAYLAPFSPTHGLAAARAGGRLTVGLSEPLEGELSVFLPLATDRVGLAVAAHHPAGEAGYAMLTLVPGRLDAVSEPRDVTVVVDVSGSMAGEKMTQARAALRALLGTLDARDRFRLLSFSNSVRAESEGWTSADADAVARAREWVERLDADGGTNIQGALTEAFRAQPGEGRLPVMIFLTDGLPTVGERDPERIAQGAEQARGRTRVFAFGVGNDVNTHLLDRLSVAARGSTDYVLPGESVERALSLLAAKIRHPVLTDLAIDGAPVRLREIYPVDLPDLFGGQELVLFARYEGGGEGEVAVTGRRGGHAERFASTASFPARAEDDAYLPRLWAARKLGHLTRQLWLEGATPSLVEEIRRTALRYGLPSEYTAYLVSEPGAVASAGGMRRAPESALRGAAPPAAPAEAQGANAVGAAARARQLRGAARLGDVDRLADARDVRPGAAADGPRLVAGRLFTRREGVWKESAPSDHLPLVAVKLFSRAWFDLLAALPEAAPSARELGQVELAGARVRIRFGDDGFEALPPDRLAALARDFRGAR